MLGSYECRADSPSGDAAVSPKSCTPNQGFGIQGVGGRGYGWAMLPQTLKLKPGEPLSSEFDTHETVKAII